MRLWIFIAGMVIISALSIWGCSVIIDTPDQVTARASYNDLTSKQSEITTVNTLIDDFTFQPVN